jgi:hypothetical protein
MKWVYFPSSSITKLNLTCKNNRLDSPKRTVKIITGISYIPQNCGIKNKPTAYIHKRDQIQEISID